MNHYKCRASNIYDISRFLVWTLNYENEDKNEIQIHFCETNITTILNDDDIDYGVEWDFKSNMSYNYWIKLFIKAEKDGINDINIMYETFSPIELYTSERLYLFYDYEE